MSMLESPKVRTIFERDGGCCRYCDKVFEWEEIFSLSRPNGWTIDHITPRVAGGNRDESNLAIACMPCNQLKGPLDEREFRLKVSLLSIEYEDFIERYSNFVKGAING